MLNRTSFVIGGLVALVGLQACSGDTLFSQSSSGGGGDDGSGTATGATTGVTATNGTTTTGTTTGTSTVGVGGAGASSTATTTGVGGASTTVTTSTGVGGGSTSTVQTSTTTMTVASSSSSGAGGSGGGMCGHPICDEGAALDENCDPCVSQICAADPFCCNGNWDNLCTDAVWNICQVDCSPNQVGCDTQYGSAPGYYNCVQNDSCTFGFSAVQQSCGQFCEGEGGECEAVYNNQGMCGLGQQFACNSSGFQSILCVCSRGCGGGPACSNGQTCNNGVCM